MDFASQLSICLERRRPTTDIESQPAVAGDSIEPWVERSGTPGTRCTNIVEPAERPIESDMETAIEMIRLSAAPRASQFSRAKFLGFRCAPPQALCYRPLPRASLDFDAE